MLLGAKESARHPRRRCRCHRPPLVLLEPAPAVPIIYHSEKIYIGSLVRGGLLQLEQHPITRGTSRIDRGDRGHSRALLRAASPRGTGGTLKSMKF